MTNLGELRANQSQLLDALRESGARVDRPNAIRCPFHDDQHASAGVYQADTGAWKFKCHGCGFQGDVIDVWAKTRGSSVVEVIKGLPTIGPSVRSGASVPPTPPSGPPKAPNRLYGGVGDLRAKVSNVQAVYEYRHPETGNLDMVVLRIQPPGGKKTFLQGHDTGAGIVLEAPPKPWPIYNRDMLARAEAAIVVEGEKCVEALSGIGLVGTTNPGGAGKSEYADWSPLAGKTVYLWPDCDAPDPKTGERTGIKHMRQVAKQLELLEPPPRLLWIDCDSLGLSAKGDVVDYLAGLPEHDDEAKRVAIDAVLQDSQPLGASSEVKAIIEDTIAGKRTAVPWPWANLHRLTNALLPGTVTLICGDPGSTKSFLLLEASAYWHDLGLPVAIYELEEDRGYHLLRALVQKCRCSLLFRDDWVRDNPDKARHYFDQYAGWMDEFGRAIAEAPDKQVTLDQLAEWVAERAQAGCRVISIDPVTAAAASAKPWIDDLSFLMRCKSIVRQYGASLVIVTHPKKGRKGGMSLEDLAGGAAFSRFSQTVLWIEYLEELKAMDVAIDGFSGATQQVHVNRVVRIRKARNGPGTGLNVGFQFDGNTFTFVEHGIEVKTNE